jgi:hypothetical protein
MLMFSTLPRWTWPHNETGFRCTATAPKSLLITILRSPWLQQPA